MSEQNYVILSDGEKYPVESLIDINAMQQIPGCSCGISLNKETYNVDTTVEVQDTTKTNDTQEVTTEQLQLYLEMLKSPKAPEKLQRKPLWCHKICYAFYDWFTDWVDGAFVLFVFLWAGICAMVGLFASCFGTGILGLWVFVSLLVIIGLCYLVVYSVDSYVPKKKAYWLDMYNNKLVSCIVRSVVTPDDINPKLCVLMQEAYTQSEKYVNLSNLVFADDEIAVWQEYFTAYKGYIEKYNTTQLKIYYPKYETDALFMQYMGTKAQYKDGKLTKVGNLVQGYVSYLKELQAEHRKQKNSIDDLQSELESLKNGTYSETENNTGKKKRKTKYVK